jgi:hypothetical protein
LLTVSEDDRPHCSVSEVTWDGSALLVPAPRGWAASEALGRQQVTLLWPPAKPAGYSLIVDGTAKSIEDEGQTVVAVVPTRAVLHRRGEATSSTGASCQSDCITIFPD